MVKPVNNAARPMNRHQLKVTVFLWSVFDHLAVISGGLLSIIGQKLTTWLIN